MTVGMYQIIWVGLFMVVGGAYGLGPLFGSTPVIKCGGSSFFKQTKLTYPAPRNDCTYTVKAHSWFVCQLRVDFNISFAPPSIASGSSYYECNDDYLEIGGQRYCGNDKQQHVYLPFNRTAGQKEVPVRIVLADRSQNKALDAAIYQIKVTQLECSLGSLMRSVKPAKSIMARTFFNDGYWIAPTGCLQYYPEPVGEFESFNFNGGNGLYPGNRDYAVCFRRSSATQGLQLTVDHFQLPPNEELQFDNACRSQIVMAHGVDDYISIPGAEITQTRIRASLFCGTIATGTVINSKSYGPLILGVHSDANHELGALRNGFRFRYNVL